MLASEAPEQQREDRHPDEQGQHKSQQIPLEKRLNGRTGRAPRCMGALVVNEIVASENTRATDVVQKPASGKRSKNSKNELEKCVNGRAGRAPRCMRVFVVNEILASETPQQSMSLKCVPVKHESNTQTSEIEHSYGES